MAPSRPETTRPSGTLLELLTLEERSGPLPCDNRARRAAPDLRGQVAEQALLAAGLTVPADRVPHSLHGYFLRGADTRRHTIFRVDRDRDGRSFSARRDDWVLVDLAPHTVGTGRGLYTGSVYSRDGVLGASLAQEALFRKIH